MADLDQGGTAFQYVRVFCGPTIGWMAARVEKQPQIVVTTGGTTTAGAGDSLILVDVAATVNIQLPNVALWAAVSQLPLNTATGLVPYIQGFERAIWVKDWGGHAAAFNITVTPFGAQKIDKFAQPFTIVQNRQLLRLYPMGDLSGWFSG